MRNLKITVISILCYFTCSLMAYRSPGSMWDFIFTNYKELVCIFLRFLELRKQFAWKYIRKKYLIRFFQ